MTIGFGPVLLLSGAVAIAALLFALQRLRVRHRVVHLPGAMLWRAALNAAPPTVLGGRFRRWPAYLLALAIALALWVSAARPELTTASGAGATVFYLDASAGMSAGDSFGTARRRLIDDVRAIPADRRTVVAGDGWGTMVLAPGENVALLAARLSGLRATARPSDVADWMARTRAALIPGTTIHYYGAADLATPPAGVRIVQAYAPAPVPGNRGIVALGVAPAASGTWGHADVLVAAVAADGAAVPASELRFTRDGRGFSPAAMVAAGPGRWTLRDIVSDGATLSVGLRPGDGLAADDVAAIRLPDRRPLHVALTAGVPESIRRAVRLDPAFVVGGLAGAQVVVRTAGERVAPTLPSLVLTRSDAQPAAFAIMQPAGEAGEIADTLDQIGLADLDAATLADQLDRPIAVTTAADDRRGIEVWDALFADAAGFARSRTLPLFVSNALRWLGGTEPWVPYARAGERWSDPTRSDASGGDPVALPAAGSPPAADRPSAIALTDRATTLARARAPAIVTADRAHGLPVDMPLITLLLFAAGLLAVEWVLFQRGAMP